MRKFILIFTALLSSLITPSLVMSQEPGTYVPTTTGCKLHYNTSQFKKMEWSGSCVDGLGEGYGTQTIHSAENSISTWTGLMVRGKSEGNGTAIVKQNGKVALTIHGVWQDNKLVSGTLTHASGAIYTGTLQDDEFHGQGTYFYPNGDSYVGGYERGVFSGHGVYTWSAGGSYEGGWLFGKKHGAGIERGRDGKITLSGYWSNGVYSRPFSTIAPGSSGASSLAPAAPAPSSLGACAENGSCYGDVSPLTGNPKTIRVDGYYRRDGTYVRGHYRSKGN